ncbi:CDP-diacylglycerol--serine O-phosphatidyltransferase [Clostridium sp. AF19-22AC]|jgi:CDP-diacylglycerol--serine O-phosphatidyltransferase|uniref:CDP-diacylglycerol--serine O-phosphatidyltransferase n=1 Tax=Faecalicatena orotica TaxID=1544 RepID=A0A2Y9B8M9_9FIRM|nr:MULTISPECIES: CDP-alcohol phosphatidyltransferase family protein [Clostridia]PWJ32370.1 CDP-diacylglycerol--serine O-phosphatidyltransferase [Faecalicatena orotica]RHR25644.1 CDP-diacylglycerol--serine O-phosphatidyltransferase [Clostridium sp. AF19-22AC]SSA54204.1 CDP-diacylglycerol---serine O-phosphatidyltransferase [Faecalicatena orotica]
MIGFYNYTVVLTYISLATSVFGMTQAVHGRFKTAILCLALSGLCDMFDGKIARRKKDRTEDEKSFGIQIDSLCDVVCFGAFPALICYLLGVRGPIGIAVIMVYCVNSVIRLAYFNVMEAKNALVTESGEKFYRGLPITSMAIVLPLVFMIQFFVPDSIFRICLHLALLIVGILFVVDFRLKKPKNATLAVLVAVVGAAVVIMIVFTRYRISFHPGWPWLYWVRRL